MHNHAPTHTHSSCVRIVSSTRSGMGKSLFITRMADKLNAGSTHVTIPIHGPEVTPDTVMEFLKDHMEDANSTIFHFDISPTVNIYRNCLTLLRFLSYSTTVNVTKWFDDVAHSSPFFFLLLFPFLLSLLPSIANFFPSFPFLFFSYPPITFSNLLLQILWKVDTILFCLLVLQGLSDSQGRVWRCHPTQLYTVEVTIPEQPKQQVWLIADVYLQTYLC